ncbi:protein jim lovell-like isoform X36 [Vespula squamosa]|uniref:Protein jim lovell-like isoform X36 n=1 Tax=Vespula squamosa TaxID=30214 RepID=A0ABD2A4L8_VESSQ
MGSTSPPWRKIFLLNNGWPRYDAFNRHDLLGETRRSLRSFTRSSYQQLRQRSSTSHSFLEDFGNLWLNQRLPELASSRSNNNKPMCKKGLPVCLQLTPPSRVVFPVVVSTDFNVSCVVVDTDHVHPLRDTPGMNAVALDPGIPSPVLYVAKLELELLLSFLLLLYGNIVNQFQLVPRRRRQSSERNNLKRHYPAYYINDKVKRKNPLKGCVLCAKSAKKRSTRYCCRQCQVMSNFNTTLL